MIKLKFNTQTELQAMIIFLQEHRPYLVVTGNPFFEMLIDSILEDVEIKLKKKIYTDAARFTITLKIHEALAILTLWMDTTKPFPDFTDYTYNIVHQKIILLQQKTH